MIPEAAGAGLGGLLGQIGDVLSKPRRFLWNDVLGLPEDGSELVSNLTGLDKEGVWAKALGIGAEMLGDPLTYAGGLLGGIGGKAAKAMRPRSAAVSGITETPGAVASAAAPRITNQQTMERFFSTPRMSADDLANSLRTDRVTRAAASSRRPQMANIQAMNETESLLRPSAAEAGRAAREPFLQAIRERPQDALLQHIYADWLDENGHGLESAMVRNLANRNGAFSGWLERPPPSRRWPAASEASHRMRDAGVGPEEFGLMP